MPSAIPTTTEPPFKAKDRALSGMPFIIGLSDPNWVSAPCNLPPIAGYTAGPSSSPRPWIRSFLSASMSWSMMAMTR